ncbi:hypothetical protein [Labrenzia sp. 011]|uniref:hypothetical protein n=1 Tax=Labrenzia sp. 011 TaxID=2171494 RepID=UPI0010571D59|nr:hypothetical protein [Labrenzia sp. 011]
MKFSAILTIKFVVAIELGLAAVPAAAFARKPPPDGSGGQALHESTIGSSGTRSILGEVWVDNWSKLHINGMPLAEDSVSIRTEHSFDAGRFAFNADCPLTIAFEFRDFKENATPPAGAA